MRALPGPEFGSGVLPTLHVAANISVPINIGQSSVTVAFTVSATAGCGAALTPVCKIGSTLITSPHAFPAGVTTVTCTGTDPGGLSDITVNQNNPHATCGCSG